VTGITGLPKAACVGQSYNVTATSSSGTMTALQWSGATVMSQSGHNAVLRFDAPGGTTVSAKNATFPAAQSAQVTTDVVDTELLLDSSVISSGTIVRISDGPTMPILKGRLKNSSGMTGTVDWKITVVFNRTNRNDTSELTSSDTAATATWTVPWGSNFYGGTATLTGTYKKDGTSTAICATQVAHIRGTNPTVTALETYIGSSPWYAVAMSRQEHGADGLQFNNVGTEGADFNTHIKNTPNRSSDNIGWGVYQLTNPVATVSQVWGWKANVDSAKSRMTAHHTEASTWITEQETQQNAEDPADVLQNTTFTWNSVNFKKGTSKTPQDACAIQRYNGVSGGWVIYWDNPTDTWKQRSSAYVSGVVGHL
jgi:hypothetical protein